VASPPGMGCRWLGLVGSRVRDARRSLSHAGARSRRCMLAGRDRRGWALCDAARRPHPDRSAVSANVTGPDRRFVAAATPLGIEVGRAPPSGSTNLHYMRKIVILDGPVGLESPPGTSSRSLIPQFCASAPRTPDLADQVGARLPPVPPAGHGLLPRDRGCARIAQRPTRRSCGRFRPSFAPTTD